MKTAVYSLALVLGVSALAFRPSPALPEGRTPARLPDLEAKAVVDPVAAAPALLPSPIAVEAPPAATRPVPPAAVGESSALLNVLVRLLALSPLQQGQVAEILAERDRRVGDYEQEMARRGWAKLSDFDRRMGEIRDLTIRRLMAVLDAAQAAEYARALAVGIPEDSVTIEIPDSVVKLD